MSVLLKNICTASYRVASADFSNTSFECLFPMRTRRIGGKPVFQQIAVLGLAIHCLVFSLPARSSAEIALPSSPAASDSKLLAENPPGDPQLLPPVVVTAESLPLTGSGTSINRKIIEKLPLRNNSINEALTILPGVQFSESANISTQGGEILPPGVSISGGKTFENNFTIDGISNNSLLDPAADDPANPYDVPGHPQQLFIDSSLVEQIAVYDSNVPAGFGGFKGGVVDAATINPATSFTGRLFYRTTRDEWTAFHIDADEREEFENSKNPTNQPEFEKHYAGVDLHIPFTPHSRLLAAYRTERSYIPLLHFDEKNEQERRLENVLFKYVLEPTARNSLSLSWVYAPYRSHYFFEDWKNSDYTIKGGGHLFSASYQTSGRAADLRLLAAYTRSENSRDAPSSFKKWKITQSRDWGTIVGTNGSMEGFFGDIEKKQDSIELKGDVSLKPVDLGPTSHQVNLGIAYVRTEGSFDRSEDSYSFYFAALDEDVACGENTEDCVDGEQYFSKRFRYPKNKAEVSLNQYGVYAENILSFKRLELRPGLRLSFDDYMNNLNLAPRLAAALDVFNNRKTVLIAGINRYYANTLLTYKLREALTPRTKETRLLVNDQPANWEEDPDYSPTTGTRYSALETPYADEYVVGIEQALFGGKSTVKYIQREGRDEFAEQYSDEPEEDGLKYHTLNNNGRSRHKSYRLSWERQWRKHYLNVNAAYEETESSNEYYDDSLDEDNLEEQVWYDGHLMKKTELSRRDFNRPWVVNLTYVGKFPYGFTFTGLAKYRSGYRALEDTGKDKEDIVLADDSSPPIYEEVKKGGSVIVSCRIDWEKRLWLEHSMVLSLEANNLLNKKTSVGNTDDYEIGRQVWAGLEYHF